MACYMNNPTYLRILLQRRIAKRIAIRTLCRSLPPDLFMADLDTSSDAVLIDLRTRAEIEADGMIEGARHIDFLQDDFEGALEPLDKYATYFVYGQRDKRGRMACALMAQRGFFHTIFLEGGKTAWDAAFNDSP